MGITSWCWYHHWYWCGHVTWIKHKVSLSVIAVQAWCSLSWPEHIGWHLNVTLLALMWSVHVQNVPAWSSFWRKARDSAKDLPHWGSELVCEAVAYKAPFSHLLTIFEPTCKIKKRDALSSIFVQLPAVLVQKDYAASFLLLVYRNIRLAVYEYSVYVCMWIMCTRFESAVYAWRG